MKLKCNPQVNYHVRYFLCLNYMVSREQEMFSRGFLIQPCRRSFMCKLGVKTQDLENCVFLSTILNVTSWVYCISTCRDAERDVSSEEVSLVYH